MRPHFFALDFLSVCTYIILLVLLRHEVLPIVEKQVSPLDEDSSLARCEAAAVLFRMQDILFVNTRAA